ncbi:MAG: ABC transporter ATP-binding protein [bacterium]|jgi:branched-chain amino acid transport system ATP-binding protein|nr:ABC transporter ATP-binding protein [bacterium]
MEALLNLAGVTRRFGGLTAVSEVSFAVQPGQIKAVIGPNGAGKTTLFNLITGVLPVSRGSIRFKGKEIRSRKPHVIGRRGISRTFQTAQIFHNMSLLENVMVGRHCRAKGGLFATALQLPYARAEEKRMEEDARRWLAFVGVDGRLEASPAEVPFVVHRKTEIARALATEPELLLLDEPAAGLNIRETEEMGVLIRAIREKGITVLIIEHDMSLIMEISDEIFVLNFGKTIAEGDPKSIQTNPAVLEAYLGKEKEHVADRESV